MKRGEAWTSAAGVDYASKPRPVVVLQDNRFDATRSITVCGLTTSEADASFVRPLVHPSENNGLVASSRLMVDKIITLPRTKLGYRIGELDQSDMVALNLAIILFLGLAGRSPAP